MLVIGGLLATGVKIGQLADLGWASVRSIEAVLTSRLGNLVSTSTEDERGCVATAL